MCSRPQKKSLIASCLNSSTTTSFISITSYVPKGTQYWSAMWLETKPWSWYSSHLTHQHLLDKSHQPLTVYSDLISPYLVTDEHLTIHSSYIVIFKGLTHHHSDQEDYLFNEWWEEDWIVIMSCRYSYCVVCCNKSTTAKKKKSARSRSRIKSRGHCWITRDR